MSASASKKKRKELEAQGLSPRDLVAREEKEQRSKTLRNVLIVVLAVVVCIAAVIGVISLVNRPSYDTKAAAVTVGDEKITVPVYDYFYNLSATNFYSNYSFMIKPNTPLSQQSSFFGEGTLEDYMKDNVKNSLREVLNLVADAKANGYELSSEDKANIAASLKSMNDEAAAYGFSSADKYLRARFGEGCDTDSYETYMQLYLTYAGYASKLNEEFQPSAEELKAAYEKDTSAYDLVSFTYATSAAESTQVESEQSEADKQADDAESTEPSTAAPTTYTDEAKAAAKEKAEGYLKEMPEDATTTSYNKTNVSSYFTEEIAEWLFDGARKEGDVKVFARDENETYFYTVRYDSRDTNDYCLVNANVITITKDKEGEEVKEGEETAKQKFVALTAAVKDGMSDEDFNKAASDLGYTVTTNSITRTYSMEEIREFLYDSNRKAGDLLTTYENDTAYYVVRYVSTDEATYRDTMVKNALWSEKYQSIATAKEITVNEDLLRYANTDLSFTDNSSTSNG